ncbi:MAG TPA: hypothetical protein DDX33_06365 [Rikenellaceae bacterium]|nr:hypothetical protein [Rikenellaceae bacterium]
MRGLTNTVLVFILLFFGMEAAAQNTSSQESRKAALEREIAQLQKQIKDNSAKSANALGELTLIRKQLSNRRELISDSEKEIKVLSDSISRARKEIKEIEDRLDTMDVYYQRLIKGAYRNRDKRIWYAHLLTSANFAQASRRYSYLKNLSSQINEEAARITKTKTDLDNKVANLDRMKANAEALKAVRQKELNQLKKDEKRSDALIATLKKDKSKYQKQLSTKQKQVEALNREIEKIIASYMAQQNAAQKSEGKTTTKQKKTIDYKLSSDFEKNKGKLPWPAEGPIVEKFGRHNHPVYTSIVMPFNNGINIALSPGTDINAVFDGEVKNIIVMPGYNKCVLIQHGNYFTFYCKLSGVDVKAGDKVKTGQKIGTVDTIDHQTQLHFQVWKEKAPQNPENWLR